MPAATRCQQENSASNANARQADANEESRRPTPGRPCWARRRRALEGAVTRGAEAERLTGWESGYREGKGIKPSIPSSFCTPKQVVLSKSVVVCGNEAPGAPRAGPRRAAAVGSGAKRRPTLATCAVCEQRKRCASNANKPLDKGGETGDSWRVTVMFSKHLKDARVNCSARSDASRLRAERREATPHPPTSLQPLGRGDVECMVDPSPRAGKTISQVALGV